MYTRSVSAFSSFVRVRLSRRSRAAARTVLVHRERRGGDLHAHAHAVPGRPTRWVSTRTARLGELVRAPTLETFSRAFSSKRETSSPGRQTTDPLRFLNRSRCVGKPARSRTLPRRETTCARLPGGVRRPPGRRRRDARLRCAFACRSCRRARRRIDASRFFRKRFSLFASVESVSLSRLSVRRRRFVCRLGGRRDRELLHLLSLRFR